MKYWLPLVNFLASGVASAAFAKHGDPFDLGLAVFIFGHGILCVINNN